VTRIFRHAARACALALVACTLATAQPHAPVVRTVTRPVLNMFSSPSTDADVVSQAIYAAPVAVLEEAGGWSRIRTADDYTGWVESMALIAQPGVYGSSGRVVQVRSLFAHVYREDSVTRHAPLVTVPFETLLEVEPGDAPSERWMRVRLPDGRRGAIQRGDVAVAPAPLDIPDTIALARRFLGLPYTWGGTSSFGFDCSGFTQMLVRQRGRVMPRDASVQAKWNGSAPVAAADLRPGDLLYFGASAERITHTGLYLGDRQFINATTHDTPVVRIDNLDDPYWVKLFVSARRVTP
jgi:hypothetical protein